MSQAPDPVSSPLSASIGTPRPDPSSKISSPDPGSRGAGAASETGPAFRALLERLEEHTRELEERSQSVDDASGLAGAVDTARASLADAVSLSDHLLEAYRQAEHRSVAPTPSETPEPQTEERS